MPIKRDITIEIRGVKYADLRSAGAAHGVSPETVRHAVRNGTLHRVGTGHGGVEPMPVRIGGKDFPSAAAAAKHFKVTKSAIYTSISRGCEDRFGTAPRRVLNNAKPFEIGGMFFVSMREADRALGFKPGFISHALRYKSKEGRQRILSAAMRLSAQAAAKAGRS